VSRPRSYRSEALVLKSTPIDEAGLIVTLYTRNAGKLRAVAPGARKPTSKNGGHLEPLNRVDLALANSRPGGMDSITQAQVIESFPLLKADLESISRGIYLAELVDGFGAEASTNPRLYSLLVEALRFLNDSPEMELALRHFEIHLLDCSGFMPELYRCVECREEIVPNRHLFSPELGGTLCLKCTPPDARIMPLSVEVMKVLRFLDRAPLQDITKLRISAGLQEGVKTLLAATLKYWLDKEIRSKSFMEHLEHSRPRGVYIKSV